MVNSQFNTHLEGGLKDLRALASKNAEPRIAQATLLPTQEIFQPQRSAQDNLVQLHFQMLLEQVLLERQKESQQILMRKILESKMNCKWPAPHAGQRYSFKSL